MPVPSPPKATPIHHKLTVHGHTRIDPYYWLREKGNPAVIGYLEAENAYAEAVMAHTAELQDRLYTEMLGRIQETDLAVPVQTGRLPVLLADRRGPAVSDLLPQARPPGG